MKTLLILTLTITASIAAHAETTAAAAFDALKKLQGEWRGPAMQKGMPPGHSVFRVTAGGSAVVETIFPGTKMEMLSVYHLDKGSLLMTHYCALGNQPRAKLNTSKSTATELVFDFAGGTNLNPRKDLHMHNVTLTLPGGTGKGRKLTSSCASWEGGKEKNHCNSTLTRVR